MLPLSEEVAAMTVKMEATEPPSQEELYVMLMRCMLELRRLSHKVLVLEDKLQNTTQ
jgi:hypothetical protein